MRAKLHVLSPRVPRRESAVDPVANMNVGARRPSLAVRAALLTIRAYQRLVRPLLPPLCRYQPTCSCYAAEALDRHGLARGAWLTTRRLLRCQPFGRGGDDPVP